MRLALSVEGRHAQYVGWVCGIARANGIDLLPVPDEDGFYTDTLLLSPTPGPAPVTIRLVVPPPPDDWRP